MIANLITTILLALGVATGNVSSNSYKGGNAFNHELKEQPKPEPKRAPDNYSTTYNYTVKQYYNKRINNRDFYDAKYYLNNQVTIATTYYNVYNTTYQFQEQNSNASLTIFKLVSIFKFTTYFNADSISLNVYQNFTVWNPTGNTPEITMTLIGYETTDNLDEYIDNTITATTCNTISTALIDNRPSNAQQTDTNFGNQSNFSRDVTNTFVPNLMLANETRYVVLITIFRQNGAPQYSNQGGYIDPSSTTISGRAIMPDLNYEVVDVPNLMFTILTLPFAWYSTAFNLTIFPGTPYALNFGNLVMTIVAALILLYLIRKIIK